MKAAVLQMSLFQSGMVSSISAPGKGLPCLATACFRHLLPVLKAWLFCRGEIVKPWGLLIEVRDDTNRRRAEQSMAVSKHGLLGVWLGGGESLKSPAF